MISALCDPGTLPADSRLVGVPPPLVQLDNEPTKSTAGLNARLFEGLAASRERDTSPLGVESDSPAIGRYGTNYRRPAETQVNRRECPS